MEKTYWCYCKSKKRLEALINKDGDHKDEEIFNELVNERFNKVIELTDKISR